MLIELFAKPVGFFLIVMMIILVTPLLSERLKLPGIIGIIIGGMLIGPHGFGLLADGDRIQFLSTIGLVYLMFSAGLEVDINQFMRVRTRALVFGLITFAVPQLMGMGLGYILGLDWLGMILLGSAFASHTLIAFPILTKLGVTRNEAVAVTIGATVMTDIGAFIVLAVVLGANKGGLSFGYFAQLFVLLALLTAAIIFGLPRLGKFIFQKINSRAVEFQFVIVTLFVAAFAAELIGVHEVVGAFLAGLAVNSMLPRHSPVAGHVLFIGESFFIPIFLLYSGLITDPLTFLKSPQTMIVAAGVTIVAYVSKFISAWITARIYKYTKSEFWTVYGLSHAQAAVTIPTLVIGLETGLFDSTLFNAAILMILLTSITSPLIVQRFAPNLQIADVDEKRDSIFGRVLVPLADTQNSEGLVTLASLLARSTHGKVLAVSVARDAGFQNNDSSFSMHKDLLGRVSETFNDPETEIELIPRMASSHAQGILHTAHEKNASLIVMGWRGKRTLRENVLGSVLDEVIWGSDTPVMVGKLPLPLNSMQHVVFIVPARAVPPIILRRMLDANLTLAKVLNVPLIVRADSSYLQTLEALTVSIETDHPIQIEALKDQLKPEILEHESVSSFIILPGFGSRKRVADTLGNLPEQLARYFDGNLAVLHFDK